MEFDATERPIPGEYHRLLGSRTGIVSELAVIAPSRHEPQVHVGTTTQADPGVLRGEDPEEMDTGGKALDPDAALQGAIGETCERYAYYWPDESAIEFGVGRLLDIRREVAEGLLGEDAVLDSLVAHLADAAAFGHRFDADFQVDAHRSLIEILLDIEFVERASLRVELGHADAGGAGDLCLHGVAGE
jgi:hypothetical protein